MAQLENHRPAVAEQAAERGLPFALTVLLACLGVLIIPLTLVQLSATRIYAWPWWGLGQAWIIMGLAAGAVAAWPRRGGFLSHSRCWLFLFALATVLVSACLAPSVWRSLRGASTLWVLCALVIAFNGYISASETNSARRRMLLGSCVASLALLVCGLSVYGWAVGDLATEWGQVDRVNAVLGDGFLRLSVFDIRNSNPFGHQNYLAGFCLLALPWALWLVFTGPRNLRLLWLSACLLILVALVSTVSRGGYLGLLTIMAGFLACALRWRWTTRRNLILATGLIVVVAVGMALLNQRLLVSAASLIASGSTGLDLARSSMLQAGWLMGRDHWLFGVGPGNITELYPLYRGALDAGYEGVYQLHNTFLQVWVELGLMGIIAIALGVGMLLKSSFRILKVGSTLDAGSAIPAMLALIGYGLFALTDYQLDVPIILGFVAVNAAIVLSVSVHVPSHRSWKSDANAKALSASLILLTVVVAIFATRTSLARIALRTGMNELAHANPEGFLHHVERAAKRAPFDEYYLNQVAAFHILQFQTLTDPAARQLQRHLTISALQRSLGLVAAQEFCHFNLGWLFLESEPNEAAREFLKAARLVPDREGVYRGLSEALIAVGHRDAAVRALVLECVAQPLFITSPIWSDPLYSQLESEVHTRLDTFYEQHAADENLDARLRSRLSQRQLVHQWWVNGQIDLLAPEVNFPTASLEFIQTLGTNQSIVEATDPTAREPWIHLYHAWRHPASRELEAARSITASTRALPDLPMIQGLVDWLNQPSWDMVLRNQPPSALQHAVQRQRSGFNLLARNMDGIRPHDLPIYRDNQVAKLYLEFFLGRRWDIPAPFLLRELDQITAELMKSHQQADGSPAASNQTL